MTSSSSNQFVRSPLRSERKVREFDASGLGIEIVAPETDPPPLPDEIIDETTNLLTSEILDNDVILADVEALLQDGYAGVIFDGPPGTSKSWYAAQVAARLANYDPERVRFVQFHPSYQYEDFVEGYVPTEDGFVLQDKHLLKMCEVARQVPGKRCVLIIDELSRSDPGRVFGEALTYIEMTKRKRPFHLSSGRETSIPDNLVFLATMNPFDRGVDEVDMAFERRFAKIEMEPSTQTLEKFLTDNGVDDGLKARIVTFFNQLQRHSNPYCKIGHAYFIGVKDEQSLKRLWMHQLRSRLKKAFPLDDTEFRKIEGWWNRVLPPTPSPAASAQAAIPPTVIEPASIPAASEATEETPADGVSVSEPES